MRFPRFKFLERGLGIRDKIGNFRRLLDQRRIDGTRTKTADTILKKTSNFLWGNFVEPGRPGWGDRPPQPPLDFEKAMREREKLKGKK